MSAAAYWREVHDADYPVPGDRPLADLTAELTRLLGDPEPQLRTEAALPVLVTWIDRGVYDDLLAGLGDGIAAGLRTGLGESGTDSVFRRSFSALVLAECISRDNPRGLVPGGKLLDWGDRLATWLLAERDLRGFVPGKGWAQALVHGAHALGLLAWSPQVGAAELVVLLDVLAERATRSTETVLGTLEHDHLAAAAVGVLRRNELPVESLEPWVARLTTIARLRSSETPADAVRGANAEGLLRALYLQLALGRRSASRLPEVGSDLLLVLVEALRGTNRAFLEA